MIRNGVTLRKDYRDHLFSYHHNSQKYGVVTPPIPKTLGRLLEQSYNQGATYLCSAYSTAMAGQYRKRIPMSPEWQSGKVSEMSGDSIAHVGADPRDAMKASCVWGHLPKVNVPFTLEEKGEDYVADWTSYTATLDALALPNSDKGYKPIIPLKDQDMFDAIKLAMWQEFCIHGDNASPALLATPWWSGFTPNCTISNVFEMGIVMSAHMYLVTDFIEKEGKEYLIIQSSEGEASIRYFSREVINKLFQNPASFVGIFNDDDRFRRSFIQEALLKLYYNLLNYLHEITR